MLKKLVVIIIACILAVVLLVSGIIHYSVPDLSSSQTQYSIKLPLEPGMTLAQSFTPGGKEFSRMRFFYEYSPSWCSLPQPIMVSIVGNASAILHQERHLLYPRFGIGTLELSLPRLSGVEEELLTISFSTSSMQHSGVSLYAIAEGQYSSGEATLDDIPLAGDLMYVTYESRAPSDLFEYLIAQSWDAGILLLIAWGTFLLGSVPRMLGLNGSGVMSKTDFIRNFLIGTACLSILFYLSGLAHIQLKLVYIFFIFLFLIIQTTWIFKNYKAIKHKRWSFKGNASGSGSQGVLFISVLGILAIISSMLWREPIFVPSWVDGRTHWEFLQGVMNAGYFMTSIDYPLGYHVGVLMIAPLLDNLPHAMLLQGQWLFILACLAFYYLAIRIFRKPWLASLSALIYAFFLPFPVYLLNWSRYPLLLGMSFLPVIMVEAYDVFLRDKKSPYELILLSVGLALTHYGSFIIFLVAAAILIIRSISNWNRKRLFSLVLIMLPAVLLITTRLGYMMMTGMWQNVLQQGRVSNTVDDLYSILGIALSGSGLFVLIGALPGIYFLYIFKRRYANLAITFLVCLILLFLLQLAILRVLIITPANLVIWSSVPLAILFVTTIEAISNWFTHLSLVKARKCAGWIRGLGYGALMILVMIAPSNNIRYFNPLTVISRETDQVGMRWLEENIMPGPRILINVMDWNGRLVPADGGGWIEAITGWETEYPQDHEELNDIATFVEETNIQYYYAGSSGISYDGKLLSELFPNLIYMDGVVRIYQKGIEE